MRSTRARAAADKDVAAILWKMAEDYQSEAVKLDSAKSPDIGEPPARLKGVLLELNNHVPIPEQARAFISALRLRGFGMATVLIVEDQEQILMLVQSFLEEQGHKTLSAATADEALAILTGSEAVDALFVDIILNGDMQAGIELAKRAVELKPRLKVVYSTGLSVTDDMKALFVPGSAVLVKPYTVDQLLTSLSAWLLPGTT